MSAKRKHTKQKATKSKRPKILNYAKMLKQSFIALCFLGVIAVPVIAYVQQSEIEHDLSVLGNGKPTVIQIHDPSCQLCRQLKSNLEDIKGDFKNDIQFKIANIATKKGQRFASKYNAAKITLLFFDKQGKRVNTLQGVHPSDEIRPALNALKNRQ